MTETSNDTMASPLRARISEMFSGNIIEFSTILYLFLVLNPQIIANSDRNIRVYQDALTILLIAFIASALLFSIVFHFFKLNDKPLLRNLFRSFLIVAVLIGLFYPDTGKHLDGSDVNPKSLYFYAIFYFLFLCALLAALYAFTKFEIISTLAYSFCVFYIVLTSIYLVIFTHDTTRGTETYSEVVDLKFGKTKNVIFIVADMLQGSTLEQHFTKFETSAPDFSGFTLFSRATSPFPFTSYALPAILSGNIYPTGNAVSYEEAFDQIQGNSIITDIAAKNFDATVISISGVLPVSKTQYSIQSNDYWVNAKMIFEFGLKRIFKNRRNIIFPATSTGVNPLRGYKLHSRAIMDRLSVSSIGDSAKRFFYIHNFIPHAPITYDAKGGIVTNVSVSDIEKYFDETEFFLGQLANLVKRMKKLGVYDSSLIVVVGDHGHFAGNNPALYKAIPGAEDFAGNVSGQWARSAAMYNAGVMFKPPLADGNLRISRQTLSTTDIRSMIAFYFDEGRDPAVPISDIIDPAVSRKIVVFKEGIPTSPYFKPDDHVVLEYRGNAADLAKMFADSAAQAAN